MKRSGYNVKIEFDRDFLAVEHTHTKKKWVTKSANAYICLWFTCLAKKSSWQFQLKGSLFRVTNVVKNSDKKLGI